MRVFTALWPHATIPHGRESKSPSLHTEAEDPTQTALSLHFRGASVY